MNLRKQAADKVARAKDIQAELDKATDLSAEDRTAKQDEIDSLLAEADDLIDEAERRERLEAAEERMGATLERPTQRRTASQGGSEEAGGDTVTATLDDPRRRTRGATSSPEAEARDHELEARLGFESLGEFAVAVRNAGVAGGRLDDRLRPDGPNADFYAAAGAQQAVGADGGFLVAPAFSQQIFDGLREASDSLLGRVTTFPVTGESLTIPAVNETSRATGSRWGGIRGYWKDEADKMTGSKPTYRQLKLEPQELYVFAYVTDKLLRNAPALEGFLRRAATDEMNWLIGDSIINGSGAGQPKGIMNSASTVVVSKEGSQAADTILYANIVKMWARLHARSRAASAWFINQDIEPQLLQLAFDPAATSKVPAYMPANGLSESPFATLMGRPVIPIEYCQTLGDKGDVILADLSSYAAGLAGGVRSDMSMHVRFEWNETAFRFLFQIDGQPFLEQPLTPANGTATLSPVVTLEARA